MRKFLLLVLFVFISSCAPWVQVGGLYESNEDNFAVELPNGWMKLRQSNELLITRDGILLQTITIKRLDVKHEFKNTKKKLIEDMLPEEVSKVVLDDISSNSEVAGFEIIESGPAKIGGMSGFKSVFKYNTKGGLKYKSIYVGFMDGPIFYGLQYIAAQRYYFDKDTNTFDRVANSFNIIKKA